MQTTQLTFDQIKSSILVSLDKKKSDQHCKLLFEQLVGKFKFRNNKYTFSGSYDLAQWLVLSFDSMIKEDEKFFTEIVIPIVAYISIVDDACDENMTLSSIAEMKEHCKIFRGEPVYASHQALKMGQFVYNLIKGERFECIRRKVLEFLVTGTNLIVKAKQECENVTKETLENFLEDRRIDSMASLFFTINNFFKNIQEFDRCDTVSTLYNHKASDTISLLNDVASIAKDTKKQLVNNYVILNKGLKENLTYTQLKQLPIEAFESSLNEVLELIKDNLLQMQTIKSSNPSYSTQFDSIDEVMKGYCTWCIISKRFQLENHLLPEYHPKMTSGELKPAQKPWADDDMDTYFVDIEKFNEELLLTFRILML
ncbi:predicted protein [Naegleria gruberi]|uniref:Predicted protein n=1 Tax=Naegleria gruberi TaxID=5762 RepID=D2VAF3_NAEGR|nr:uncharacterized protein NAEGRDRAFT_65839 [Naegleria gruberi]EFC46299.1 predicted protein [Naegleria gruberi]|eukprot:XP_002679043.1 predicted protein [Naegleria gruberi strain NEG-M]